MPHSILHIAPENTAGVPYNVHNMQNQFGMYSRLITFYKIPYDFPEDICLDLPLPRGKLAMWWRKFKQSDLHKEIDQQKTDQFTYMPYFAPKNLAEGLYLKSRQMLNEKKFVKALKEVEAERFDKIQFDGGVCFYTDNRMAKKWKKEGKKIINCYYGDDLRTRGIVKEMDELSDLNLTFEYDHTLRHPDINYLFFPFENEYIKFIPDEEFNKSEKIRVIHSPTNRIIKGTPEIIEAVEKAQKSVDFEFILVENRARAEVIKEKYKSHIAIDQIGNRGGTGYGINSLETLSMGLPTITDMNCGMDSWLPENPFIVANKDNLSDKLIEIISNRDQVNNLRNGLREWVDKYHSYASVYKNYIQILKNNKII